MIDIPWLDPHDRTLFPEAETALRDPDGLLAVGGDLSPERLLNAYRRGIFPWYSEGQPILWWSPDPRLVLFPDRLHVSRSLRKTIRKAPFSITLDRDFPAVIRGCAMSRQGTEGTWITEEMEFAYQRLFELGWAHSVEAWQDGYVVGGLYGVAIGQVFFGESMFNQVADASKIAFVHLVHQLHQFGVRLIDCQVETAHLSRFGAELISRRQFLDYVSRWTQDNTYPEHWNIDASVMRQVEHNGGVFETGSRQPG